MISSTKTAAPAIRMPVSTSSGPIPRRAAHCVQAVTTEIEALPGVEGVLVDLPSGVVTVTSADQLSDDSVRAAVDEAGYELADA